MPRYFFHVHDGVESVDHDGTEFPDDQAAREEAVRAAGELLRDEDGRLVGRSVAIRVVNEAGQPVLEIDVETRVSDGGR